MPETPFFSCEDLSLDLGGREVLSNISLELRRGEVLGIIGPNGAGKTSLLEILSGRYAPKSGKVFLEGRDINDLSLFQRARLGIGRTYQTPIVPEELTVGETMKAARQAFRPWLTRFDAEYGANLVHFRVPYDRPTVSSENLRAAQAADGVPADAAAQNSADGRARRRAHQCRDRRDRPDPADAVQGNERRGSHRRAPHRAPRSRSPTA